MDEMDAKFLQSEKKKKKKKIYTAVSEISCMFSIDGMSQQYRENIIVARKYPSFLLIWPQFS